jgi:gamma-glutamyltranspeptidase / glutathione hydrolase
MTPTIVLKDGQPVLAVGSPGGPTIINTVLEVIVNVLDFNMNVQDAVNWPRFHHQWMPDQLRMEPGYSPDTVALLEKRGYSISRAGVDGRPISQGEAAAIRFANGWLEGAPDPRTEGTAEGH